MIKPGKWQVGHERKAAKMPFRGMGCKNGRWMKLHEYHILGELWYCLC
jgi:hypothetical protein